ncbi:MAG: adenylate kinase [Bacteroidales bacterium]|jgi:adenylate kinase|nr:adenylate kinase [Bacteroidales bacterium]
MLNIILFGAPGSGKGTQSENIISKYQLTHLSTGDIMREEMKNETKIGKLVKDYINKGLLVPDSIILEQLISRTTNVVNTNGFIFDGFPRTLNQAVSLDEMLNTKNAPVSMVIFLNVAEEELFNRIMYRSQHSNRGDDNAEIIKKRIEVYREQTEPLLEYYKEQGKLSSIEGMGTIEEIFGLISEKIDEYVSKKNIVIK